MKDGKSKEEQSYVGEEQQEVENLEDGQPQGTTIEDEDSKMSREDGVEEGHEGVWDETLQVCERSKLRGIIDWLCLLLLNVYWIIFEDILTWTGDQWKLGRERKPV